MMLRAGNMPIVNTMGYSNVDVFKDASMTQLEGARALARRHGFKWDVAAEDPRVIGRRFLADAKIVL